MAFKTLKVRLTGASPLLLHNGQTANPLNVYAKQLKAVSSKRNKTEEDFAALAKIEFLAGLYTDSKGAYTLPGHNLEAALLEGARKNKNGRQVQGGAFVVNDPKLTFPGSEKKPEDLWEGQEHALMVSVRVQKNRVMRCRPLIPTGWTCVVEMKYDPAILEEPAILQAWETAGLERGIGDWRPKYGRFSVESV